MRKPIIAGNWKMNTDLSRACELTEELVGKELATRAEVILCPPFVSLAAVGERIADTPLKLGAQNMHWEESGAFTGEISPTMLTSVGCEYVILGHSERRQLFSETDPRVNKKAKAALDHGLTPIICVGETLRQREEDEWRGHIESQVKAALINLSAEEVATLVMAYEPIWAIGTGKTATVEQANEVCRFIRVTIETIAGHDAAEAVRILYGGSVKPDNIRALMAAPHIDGALVGGASLKADDFAAVVNYEK